MILDKNLCFDTANAITTTRDSTNIIDLSQARDLGTGGGMADINVWVEVSTTMTSSTTTATLTTAFEVSTDNSTYTTAAQTDAISTASLTAGTTILNIKVPARRLLQGDALPRYCKLVYTCSATFGAGAVSAYLAADRQVNDSYPSGFTVVN